MSIYHIYQDRENCIGCHSCEVHCKDNKELPPGPRLCRMITVGPRMVDNALKATAATVDGVVRIEAEAAGRLVRVTVADNGVGFAPAEAGRLFEKFHQAPSRHRSSIKAGSGLGLYLVRRLVELAGGQVTAASDGPGRGASFAVSWPAATEVARG